MSPRVVMGFAKTLKQPFEFPFAKIPRKACPEVQGVGVAARAEAVAALPVVFWFRVGMKFAGIGFEAL
jgi:hypothetical protein